MTVALQTRFAIRAAASPTAPAVPVIKIVSLGCNDAASTTARQAVRYGIPTLAACSNVSDFGFGLIASTGTLIYSASDPSRAKPMLLPVPNTSAPSGYAPAPTTT